MTGTGAAAENRRVAGIIGCGAVAEEFYAKVLPALPGVTIGFVCDLDASRAQRLAGLCGARAVGLDELRRASDVICVCTPPDSHHALLRDSLAAGKAVISEKPFVPGVAQARELCARAAELGASLSVAHFRRLYPSVVLARQLLGTLDLGRLERIKVVEGRRFNWQAKSDYFVAHPLGGVLLDTGSHALDMALHIAGMDEGELAVRVTRCERDRSEPSHRVRASLSCELATLAGPVAIDLFLSRYEALANQITFMFERGRVIVPAALTSHVLIHGPRGRTVVHARRTYATNLEVFYDQYREILDGEGGRFQASRFVNLTRVLEAVASAPEVSA